MDASTTFMVYTFAVALCILHCQVASSLHYEVYNTTQRRSIVVDGRTSPFKYNHDSSIAYFQGFSGFFPKYLNILSIPSGKWIVLWNANTVPKEGAPGQVNLMSVANDTAYGQCACVCVCVKKLFSVIIQNGPHLFPLFLMHHEQRI
eukprot:m.240118 g.240118  ORF g.240118 m.240118 type:complete len:147 (-) comp16074_c0_seq26:2376-2816(-)